MKAREAEFRSGEKNSAIKDSAIVAGCRMERVGKKGAGGETVDAEPSSAIAGGKWDNEELITMNSSTTTRTSDCA